MFSIVLSLVRVLCCVCLGCVQVCLSLFRFVCGYLWLLL